ncbi:MAG: 3-phosphoshikimate 1-carboxyvinyltransferase [Desulfohalobiaceae bacterium]|nr:3-phosphoshikimate 1-carboxyvinyltransferase [Desulfohalobiaceae bacterium]
MPLTISAPSSKSLSHRALIAASLARGESCLSRVLDSQDLQRTMDCLQTLGAGINEKQGDVKVTGIDWFAGKRDDPLELDVGESGTTCRLITPLCALGRTPCRVFGRGRMHSRPLDELAEALIQQGSSFEWLGREGCPPFVLKPGGLRGGEVEISLEQSSQYLSGLLLAAPLAARELIIRVGGSKSVSWPYVALTLEVMDHFGAEFEVEVRDQGGWTTVPRTGIRELRPGRVRFRVQPSGYRPGEYSVEGDWSNASYFLAAGALLADGIKVRNLNPDSIQGDSRIQGILKQMGARIQWDEKGLSVYPGQLQGTELDMGSCPDLVPTVAVLASLARGETRISNVAHLRLKESDRLQALAAQITKTGSKVRLLEDGLLISPANGLNREPEEFETYGDHRIAMSLSLYGLAGVLVRLDDPGCVAKSFPGFWQEWEKVKP